MGIEHLTSRFETSEGFLAFLSELAMFEEPCFGLFDRSLDLGVAMNTEVAVRNEIRNNDSVGCGSRLGGNI